jgi:hypothetical protein
LVELASELKVRANLPRESEPTKRKHLFVGKPSFLGILGIEPGALGMLGKHSFSPSHIPAHKKACIDHPSGQNTESNSKFPVFELN